MCGITGFFGQQEIVLSDYYKAHKALDHRGPDDEGFLIKSMASLTPASGDKTIPERSADRHLLSFGKTRFCLGHHRLKIVDLSPGGHQPFQTMDGRHHIIFNGEVYNYLELRAELQALGHRFHTNSDTEVVLAAFSEWEEECFNKFNGMWGMVIYDSQSKLVYLCRDRFGVKPLYYYRGNDTVYFASELKFFKQLHLSLTLNKKTASDFLQHSFLDYDRNTFFEEISSVPPAHCMVFNDKGEFIRESPYWQLDLETKSSLTMEAVKAHLEDLFHSSLELRMRSDVPVGTLLSGGLDSTSIACHLAKNFKLPNGKIESFSAVFKEEQYSEKNYIDKTVELYPQIHPHFIYPVASDIESWFNDLTWTIEAPVRSLAVFSQYKIYEHIKNNSNIVVLLNGQGADEIFGGYSAHYSMYFAELIKSARLARLKNEVLSLHEARPYAMTSMLLLTGKNIAPNFLKPKKSKTSIFENATPSSQAYDFTRSLKSSLAFDLQVSALPEYLHYEDRNSMRFSKETRLPFLDFRMVEFVFTLPSEAKINHGVNKYIMREVVKDYLPKEILERKDKMGFTSPQEKWERVELKSWLKDGIFTPDSSGVYDQKDVENLYLDNDTHFSQKNQDILWRIFCFKKWHKLFLQN